MKNIDNDFFIDLGDYKLRSLDESDLDGPWFTWLNDSVVNKFQNKGIYPNSLYKQKQYFEKIRESDSDVVLAIIDKENNRHIGNIGVHGIDYVHRRAEIGIVIGEKEYWGQGIGKDAIKSVMNYAFNTLNLVRLYVHVMEENKGSIKIFESNGFKREGLFKNHFFKNGCYKNVVYLAALREEV